MSTLSEVATVQRTEIKKDVIKKKIWSFSNFSKVIVNRQVKKEADTFIIIYGLPRTGKTTLGFDILIPLLQLMRKLNRLGLSEWEVPYTWKQIFERHFAGDAEDMLRKIKELPERSFIFVDEGIDILSWHDQMAKEQQNLIELLQKAGKKRMLIIAVVPSLSLLTKPILAKAHYMFMITTEPSSKGNYAYLLKNYTNPILAENFPFGMKKIVDTVLKHPAIAEEKFFESFIVSRDRFIAKVKYKPIDRNVYELYDRLVKDPSIMRTKVKSRSVSYRVFYKLQYAFDTLIYRLKNSDDKSVMQIKNLLVDKFGNSLASTELIRDHIAKLEAMEKPPQLTDEEILEGKEKPVELEDISLDSIFAGEEEPSKQEEIDNYQGQGDENGEGVSGSLSEGKEGN